MRLSCNFAYLEVHSRKKFQKFWREIQIFRENSVQLSFASRFELQYKRMTWFLFNFAYNEALCISIFEKIGGKFKFLRDVSAVFHRTLNSLNPLHLSPFLLMPWRDVGFYSIDILAVSSCVSVAVLANRPSRVRNIVGSNPRRVVIYIVIVEFSAFLCHIKHAFSLASQSFYGVEFSTS